MTTRQKHSKAQPADATDALIALMVEAIYTSFRLRAAGRAIGAVTPAGGGAWGLLRTLTLDGPRTVPDIARARPVSRQHIQTLADALAAEGLVRFVDNPAHKRSKLVAITPKGRRRYDEMTARIRAAVAALGDKFDAAEVETATKVLARLRGAMDIDK